MRYLFLLFVMLLPAVASPQSAKTWPLTAGTAVLGGNSFSPQRISVIGRVVYLDDYQIIPRVPAQPVIHASVVSTDERIHELCQFVFSHPEWTIEDKLAVFTSATDVVESATANPQANSLQVKFKGNPDAESIDLNPSTATDVDTALMERVENIRLLLELGGRFYQGDDYEILLPRQQVQSVDAHLLGQTMRAVRSQVNLHQKFASVIRDQKKPVPLNHYRTRR